MNGETLNTLRYRKVPHPRVSPC